MVHYMAQVCNVHIAKLLHHSVLVNTTPSAASVSLLSPERKVVIILCFNLHFFVSESESLPSPEEQVEMSPLQSSSCEGSSKKEL